MERLGQLFKALADETRLRILNLLSVSPLSVTEIMEILGISQSKASRHLIYLKNSGLVNNYREGASVYYTLVHPKDKTHKEVLDCLEGCFFLKDVFKEERVKVKERKGIKDLPFVVNISKNA